MKLGPIELTVPEISGMISIISSSYGLSVFSLNSKLGVLFFIVIIIGVAFLISTIIWKHFKSVLFRLERSNIRHDITVGRLKDRLNDVNSKVDRLESTLSSKNSEMKDLNRDIEVLSSKLDFITDILHLIEHNHNK